MIVDVALSAEDLDDYPVIARTWWLGWFPKEQGGGCAFWIDADAGAFRHFDVMEELGKEALLNSFHDAIDRDDEHADYGRPSRVICTEMELFRLLEPLQSDIFHLDFQPFIPYLSELFETLQNAAQGRREPPDPLPGMDRKSSLVQTILEQSLSLHAHDPWSMFAAEAIFCVRAEDLPDVYLSFREDSYGPSVLMAQGEEAARAVFQEGEFVPEALALSYLPREQARGALQQQVQELGLSPDVLIEVTSPKPVDYPLLIGTLIRLNLALEAGLQQEQTLRKGGLTLPEGAGIVSGPHDFEPSPRGLVLQANWHRNVKKREQAARVALERDPDCAEAHHLLAGHAALGEVAGHRRRALEARSRRLGQPQEAATAVELEEWLADFHLLVQSLQHLDDAPQKVEDACRAHLEVAREHPLGPAATLVFHLFRQARWDQACIELKPLPSCLWVDTARAFALYLRDGDEEASVRARQTALTRYPGLVSWLRSGQTEQTPLKELAEAAGGLLRHRPDLTRWLKEGEVARGGKKLGRNDPCWCGSGKKYKKCHLKN